jgi:hypothetical protein
VKKSARTVPLAPPLAPIYEERTTGEKQGRARQLLNREPQALDCRVERVHGVEGERELRADHRVDEQLVHLGLRPELSNRPVRPRRVVLQNVEQDVGVD